MTERVTILGGGLSGLTTAFNLTTAEQAGRYDVTVYQHGWRLGGKCATGRNEDFGNRIQEHGLHVFMGQYDNAFEMVQTLYKEAQNPPFDDWRKGFSQEPNVTLMEKLADGWVPWEVPAPIFPGTPGIGTPPTIWERMIQFIEWIASQIFDIHRDHLHSDTTHWAERIAAHILSETSHIAYGVAAGFVHTIHATLDTLQKNTTAHHHENHIHLAKNLTQLRDWIQTQAKPHLDDHHDFRRAMVIIEIGLATIIGGLLDGLLIDPDANLERVNQTEYKHWLRSHGCAEFAVESAVIRGLYDLIFAYEGGDWQSDGNTEAGTMFMSLMNTSRYRGALLWKFNTATGDLVMSPMYEVLKARGVKFKFFHRVDELIPSETGNWIGQVKLGRQVNIKGQDYDPFRILPSGQRVWPDRPIYDRIQDGEKLKESGADLESHWTQWKDQGDPLTLKMGDDYDWLVLAIPPGAHPTICKKLMAQKPDWNAMVNKIQTTATQSIQTWMDKDEKNLGWKYSSVTGAYDKIGLDTWSDISEVLATETWPASSGVVSEQIACGPLPCPQFPPAKTDTDYPVKAYTKVAKNLENFLTQDAELFWPEGFGQHIDSPVKSKYIRANVDPTERYTLTVTGSTKYRFKTNESGYRNLILTGDWILNGQNQGSFEATTISGKLASKAISGIPKTIFRIDADKYVTPSPHTPAPNAKPPFISHGGLATFPGPIKFTDLTMNAFLLNADMTKLQDFCTRIFTNPSSGNIQVLPLAPVMMMTIVDIPKGVFVDSPQMGWSGEKELAFWIPVVRVKMENGKLQATHFNMTMPYLALDNPTAIASGREIFGYWKKRGWINMPKTPKQDLTVDLFSTQRFGPTSEEKRNRWLTLSPLGATENKTLAGIDTFADGIKALHAHLDPEITKWHAGLGFDLEMLGELMKGQIPQLFLKQFRDIENGNMACYQAITEANANVTSFQAFPKALLYNMQIAHLDSSPVAQDFGIDPMQTVLGAQLKFSMDVQPGKTLWEA